MLNCKDNDLFFRCETWFDYPDCELCDFHVFLPVQRTKYKGGGLLCAVKEWQKPYVSISGVIFNSIIWLKIEKTLFDCDIDINVTFTYIPQEESVFNSANNIDIFYVYSRG